MFSMLKSDLRNYLNNLTMFVTKITLTKITFSISPKRFLRILNINKVRKILTGINNKEKTVSSRLPLNIMVATNPINKKISIFRFFLLLNPVEYIMPRKLTNENNR